MKNRILLIILCLVVGFALRFYTFDRRSLWIDEIYTFGDSRDDIKDQLEFYKRNPTYLHPPLFFVLTHQLYPFTKPERDLRIIPLVFGTLCIPMIYFLATTFSYNIGLPCALSLTLMTYHISLSQDARSYSLLMFLGMAGLYFFMKHMQTLHKKYLLPVALLFSILFYMSYTSILFVLLSQVLWLYRPRPRVQGPSLYSPLILNGLILLFCLPWIVFLALNLKGGSLIHPLHTGLAGSFPEILYGVLHDWMPYAPLSMISAILLVLFPFLARNRQNALILLMLFVLPIGSLYLFCRFFDFTHFFTSRYVITFLPPFLITLFLSLDAAEERCKTLRKLVQFKTLFVILVLASNLVMLPLYYRHEKQDFRGIASFLRTQLQDRDRIVVQSQIEVYGLLHYFGIELPKSREYLFSQERIFGDEIGYAVSLIHSGNRFTLSYPKDHSMQFVAGRNRTWLLVDKKIARAIKSVRHFHLMGYFNGGFLSLGRFPSDASMYLFLWDPQSPDEKGMDLPID